MKTLEERLERLEAAEQIRALKMRYAQLCDAGYPTDQLEQLFIADAVWDGGDAFGHHEGWPAIRAFFDGASTQITWAMHYTVAGDIHVADDGRSARATWYLWQPMTFDDTAVWLIARYADSYVVDAGEWKFSKIALDVQALTPIDRGWVTERFATSD